MAVMNWIEIMNAQGQCRHQAKIPYFQRTIGRGIAVTGAAAWLTVCCHACVFAGLIRSRFGATLDLSGAHAVQKVHA